jgi:hypothetical protein
VLHAEGAPFFAYVAEPLHRLERLKAGTRAPRVMWTDQLARSGIDNSLGSDQKVARSMEMTSNWIDDDLASMRRYADCIHKVEEALPELRDYERALAASNS